MWLTGRSPKIRCEKAWSRPQTDKVRRPSGRWGTSRPIWSPNSPARADVAAVRLILDTDASPDFDDIGALAILHTLADSGEAEILATDACNRTPLCVPVIEIVNAHYGRAALPVGCVRRRDAASAAAAFSSAADGTASRFAAQSSVWRSVDFDERRLI